MATDTPLRALAQAHYSGPLNLELLSRRCSFWIGELRGQVSVDLLALDLQALRAIQGRLGEAKDDIDLLCRVAHDLANRELNTHLLGLVLPDGSGDEVDSVKGPQDCLHSGMEGV